MKNKKLSPWAWIPTLYFAQGLPYVAVMTISVIMYKKLGISNTDIALYTSWLYLPWVIKPFWSPFIDLLKTKRWWVVTMQILVGAGLAGIAFTIPMPNFFQITLAIFWLVAFSSATHDIAADGFYMLALSVRDQAMYVGIRSTFYRIATIAGQGLLVVRRTGKAYFYHSHGMEYYILYPCRTLHCILFIPQLHFASSGIRQAGSGQCDREQHIQRVLCHIRKFLQKAASRSCHIVHAVLPLTGSTIGKAYQSFSTRSY